MAGMAAASVYVSYPPIPLETKVVQCGMDVDLMEGDDGSEITFNLSDLRQKEGLPC